jgi:hypothetical protein
MIENTGWNDRNEAHQDAEFYFFGVRRHDGAFSSPARWSVLGPARQAAPSQSGDTSPHSKVG